MKLIPIIFRSLDIVTYWCDLVYSGIHPSDVKLVGIEGGDIAAMEYQIALSLGAKVGLLANSGRAANDFLQDKSLVNYPNILQLSGNQLNIWKLLCKSNE